MIATAEEARALLAERLVLPLTRVPPHECLVELVAGEPVKGTWWAHPAGNAIYAVAEALSDAPGVMTAKLLAGKVTFVDAALWPALLRVVALEPTPRGLSAASRAMLREVAKGDVRVGAGRKAPAEVKEELETRLLVAAEKVHTEKGSHATIYRAWSRWAPPELLAEARAMDLEVARARVLAAARGAPVPALAE